MSRGDPAARLMRALVRRAGAGTALSHEGMTPWSSATFVGAQHRVRVTGFADWTAELDEADLPLPGCFVASVDIERSAEGALLTILVLDE